MLVQRLSRFRLRVEGGDRGRRTLAVYAAWDGAPDAGAARSRRPDPRLPRPAGACCRRRPLAANAERGATGTATGCALGLPDGSRDLEAEKTVLLEAGFDELRRRVLDQGLLHGPGAHRADQISRPAEAAAGAGARGRGAAGAGHAGAARGRGGRHDAVRAGRARAGGAAASGRSRAGSNAAARCWAPTSRAG